MFILLDFRYQNEFVLHFFMAFFIHAFVPLVLTPNNIKVFLQNTEQITFLNSFFFFSLM